jgi:threonine dehydrogenase-like Zn-dependent dehydrogenase
VKGLPTACVNVRFVGNGGLNGAQAEALRMPFADGTLFPIDVTRDDAPMPALLTLSDVMGTGHHAAVVARVTRGHRVAVVGDGAVGLCGVIAAKRLGAQQIIILGRRLDRIALARVLGATDVVSERGAEAVEGFIAATADAASVPSGNSRRAFRADTSSGGGVGHGAAAVHGACADPHGRGRSDAACGDRSDRLRRGRGDRDAGGGAGAAPRGSGLSGRSVLHVGHTVPCEHVGRRLSGAAEAR